MEKYHMITVLNPTDERHNRWVVYNAVCDCGKEIKVTFKHLKSGGKKSCGCYRKSKITKQNTTHGKSKHPLYARWFQIKQRCYNPNHDKFRYYGERGIKVCAAWLDDPQNFYDWFYTQSSDLTLTVDRVDTYGDYSPENCRLITLVEQQHNRRPRSPNRNKKSRSI